MTKEELSLRPYIIADLLKNGYSIEIVAHLMRHKKGKRKDFRKELRRLKRTHENIR